MILVDTSVWVNHLRAANEQFSLLLRNAAVLTHPFVIGELACGNLKNRSEILGLLRSLPHATLVSNDEVLALVESRRLHGKGLGWVDVHLLASTLLDRRKIWTADKRLAQAAKGLGVAV